MATDVSLVLPRSPARVPRVLVLGASFAGLEVLWQLRKRFSPAQLDIMVVDRAAAHGYLPLVHERLCGTLDPDASILPTRARVEGAQQATFVQGEVCGMDPAARIVMLNDGRALQGDVIVVALGSDASPPKTLPGASQLLRYKDPRCFATTRDALATLCGGAPATVAVVGGGVSAVELAGELAAWRSHHPPAANLRVVLLSRSNRLLASLPRRIGARAQRHLLAQGVEVRMRCSVSEVMPDGLHVHEAWAANEEPAPTFVPADAMVWAGGVQPSASLHALGLAQDETGYVVVRPTLQVMGHDPIFCCGDAAVVHGATGRWPTMKRAIECLWQAKVVACNVAVTVGCAQGAFSWA